MRTKSSSPLRAAASAALVWAAPFAHAGCASPEPFPCTANDVCTHDGAQGICEVDGFCSFPDGACAGLGRRYGFGASDERANQCVVATAPACVAGLSLGAEHSCALETDGSVWCWGSNAHGQLGAGAKGSSAVPRRVEGLPTDVAKLSAGEDHTCILTRSGRVWCWGSNESGQLGVVTGDPPAAAAGPGPFEVKGMPAAEDVTGGGKHTCAVAGGDAYCWGSNGYSQLGDGTQTDRLVPEQVPTIAKVAAIEAGDEHSCAVLQDGRVFCWGTNEDGQCGLGASNEGSASPAHVKEVTGAEYVVAGDEHTCIGRADETIWCWGYNASGGVGDGTLTDRFEPAQVSTGPAVFTGAASFHTCALVERNGGELWCWGANDDGQIGSGSTDKAVKTPSRARLATVTEIVATGATHSCAVTTDGALWCWGNNEDGQLGIGEAGGTVPSPRRIALCQ